MGEARCSVMVVKNSWKLHLENNKNRDHWGNMSVNGAITLSWHLEEQVGRLGTGFVCLF
jgi:hypothetical protein